MKRIYVGIFVMALTTLMMELVLTRVFDVILSPNMAYMVITCAMFNFGLAGIYAVLRPLPEARIRNVLSTVCLLFAGATLLLRPVLNWLPFNYDQITAQPVTQVFSFLGMYLALALPFFFSGLVFTGLFSAYASKIRPLYFADLVGAGIGCAILIPFITPIGPGGLLFVAAALGLCASALFSERGPVFVWPTLAAALVLAGLPFVHVPQYFDFVEHLDKRGVSEARVGGEIELTRWDPISKIDIVPLDDRPQKHIAYDGGNQSSKFYASDGDFDALRQRIRSGEQPVEDRFWFSGVLASHYLKRDTGHRALIVGSAGGQETTAALMFGAAAVDAVELVGAVVDMGHNEYADYTGRLFHDPRVNAVHGEGRTFLRASSDTYDVIQLFSNHTSSSVAGGAGAMSPVYLQTVEAYTEYFGHLADDGILHINHHIYPRMIATAASAWKALGRSDFRRHVIVFQRQQTWDSLPTLLIKMTPWTRAELDEATAVLSWSADPRALVENPLDPAASFLSDEFYSGDISPELESLMPYRITPATDNNPYFSFLRESFKRLEPDAGTFVTFATAEIVNRHTRKFVPMDVVHLIVTAFVSLTFAFVFLYVPLRMSAVGRATWPGRPGVLTYFACLGAGFIIIELVLIQIFMKVIGFPLYAVSLVILTMLVAAGIGSLTSQSLGIGLRRRWRWPFIGVGVLGALFAASYPAIFQVVLGWPLGLRVAFAFAMIFPLGYFLGMPFPLGILSLERMPKGAVAWAWALNGLFTLIGGLLSVVLSLFIGFRATLLLGLAVYGLAYVMFSRLRLASHASEAAVGTGGAVTLDAVGATSGTKSA